MSPRPYELVLLACWHGSLLHKMTSLFPTESAVPTWCKMAGEHLFCLQPAGSLSISGSYFHKLGQQSSPITADPDKGCRPARPFSSERQPHHFSEWTSFLALVLLPSTNNGVQLGQHPTSGGNHTGLQQLTSSRLIKLTSVWTWVYIPRAHETEVSISIQPTPPMVDKVAVHNSSSTL